MLFDETSRCPWSPDIRLQRVLWSVNAASTYKFMFIGGEIKRDVVPAISKFAAAKQKCATETKMRANMKNGATKKPQKRGRMITKRATHLVENRECKRNNKHQRVAHVRVLQT